MYEAIEGYVRSLIERSTPERTVWNVERLQKGKPMSWNYIDGCMLTALMEMSRITGDDAYFDFARAVADTFVGEDGAIRTFDADKHNLDDINEGRVLFELYERTGLEKYRRAAVGLWAALNTQPRTFEGSFWHKQIYPNQVWLDGIYMAQPFSALYQKHFGAGDYSDVFRQIMTVQARMRDRRTGLYCHGYDASRAAFWADPVTGRSKCFWLRSLGWFSVALADLIEIIPPCDGRNRLIAVFADLMKSLLAFSDPETGMYSQVPDRPDEKGNYLESSGSAMVAYAMLKGARLGVLDKAYAAQGQKTFDGIIEKYLRCEGGEMNLGGICLVAGLGPEDNRRRDGTYAYYISEPVVENDAKGVAPFVLCYTEIRRLQPGS